MPHECKQEAIIRKLEIELAVAQSDISSVKNDISAIFKMLNKFTWWFIGIMVSLIGGMGAILIAIILKLKG
jgi:hypothetical protein